MDFGRKQILEEILIMIETKSRFVLVVSMIRFELERLKLKDARIAVFRYIQASLKANITNIS